MIKSTMVQTFDWQEDVEPIILKNLNELLVAEGTDPLGDLHGGNFKDGKWVSSSYSDDYRNYWHVYLDLFCGELRNDSYQVTYFSHPDDDEAWDGLYHLADKFADKGIYKHSDMKWPRHLVTAVREMYRENLPIDDLDGSRIVFWWSW